jgi:Domain of Unknown Function (DUF1080)
MNRLVLRLPLFLVAMAVLAVSVLGARQAPVPPPPNFDPVLGRWDLTVQGAGGPYPSWVQVQLRKETELQGRFVGQFGSVRNITKIGYGDGTLAFDVPVQYETNKSDLHFVGKLVGDTLEGTTLGADGAALKWTGVRAPAFGPDKQVEWGAAVELFNGRDLSGWKPRSSAKPGCWTVVEGTLTLTPPCVDLVSDRAFGDAKLHVEFMYPARSNSGLYLRGRYEVQIQDDAGRGLDALRMGGVYGFIRPYTDAAGRAGDWQTYDITLRGQRVTIALNGKTIADNEVITGITGGALDSAEGTPGPLMLQGDHGKVSFKKITLTPAK